MKNETSSVAAIPGSAPAGSKGGSGDFPDEAAIQGGTSMPANSHTVSKDTRRRVITASFIGNFVEWFDYAVYGYLAGIISTVFFPASDRQTALLATFGVFAVSFFVRPLGGFIWGHIGDRLGRKQALSLSIVLMSVATFCIALIPGYNTIGVMARSSCCSSGLSRAFRRPANTQVPQPSWWSTRRPIGADSMPPSYLPARRQACCSVPFWRHFSVRY
ncbi:proline/betaine transporter [Arthrobacter sp. Hiyo8]|nr:proline/betaine transporter [Arthrobacter sp. Hiyo8]